MDTLTADTALVESYLWIPEALLYLPVGVLAAIVVLELIDGVLGTRDNDRAILTLLIFGLITTFLAAHLGIVMAFFLGDWGSLPFRQLLPGYFLGLILLITWALKLLANRSWRKSVELAEKHLMTKHRTQGSRFLTGVYRLFLLVSILVVSYCISYKADFGEAPAYVTLGFPGKASSLPKPPALKPPSPPAAIAAAPSPENESPAASQSANDPDSKMDSDSTTGAPAAAPSEPPPQPMPKTAAPAKTAKTGLTVDFLAQVEPILERSCYDCHGLGEDKAGLRLHTPEAIRKGSDDGLVIAPGKPNDSSLYFLTILPPDDEDIMPSKGDALTKEETEILRVWILEGAHLADGKAFDDTTSPVASTGGDDMAEEATDEPPLSTMVVIPNADYLKILRDGGIDVKEAEEELMLEVDYSKAGKAPGEIDLKVLFPLARNIVALDLSKTKVTDEDLEPLREFTNLVHLRLDRTNTGDATLRYISNLTRLETLNLFGTRVTDSGVNHLDDLESLKVINLMNTMVTAQSAGRLQKSLPGAEIQAME